MNIKLPLLVSRNELEGLAEKLKKEYSDSNLYPELLIVYTDSEEENKIIVLGYGSRLEVARQVANVLREHPNLRKKTLHTKVVREGKYKGIFI